MITTPTILSTILTWLAVRTSGYFVGEVLDNVLARLTTLASRVTETAETLSVLDVENQVIAGAGGDAHGNAVQAKLVAGTPCYDVVGTSRVTARS